MQELLSIRLRPKSWASTLNYLPWSSVSSRLAPARVNRLTVAPITTRFHGAAPQLLFPWKTTRARCLSGCSATAKPPIRRRGSPGRLMKDLVPSDRAKINQYFEAIRDVERRIQVAEEQGSRELPALERPAGIP